MRILRNTAGSVRPAAAFSFAGLALVAAAATALAVGGGSSVAPSAPARPSASAVASAPPPAATPMPTAKSAEPTPVSTPRPAHTNSPTDPEPIKVDLQTVDGHAVRVDITDLTGILESAVSGRPAEGASAEGLVVENVDARTLRLTWVDFPIDNADTLYIEWFEGRLSLLLVQPEPRGDTDAVAYDRELILTFAEPISAVDVEAHLTKGLDTNS